MGINQANFPNWDGTTPTRPSRHVNRRPDPDDHDQLSAEVLAIQDCFQRPGITELPADPTILELAAKVNEIIITLREANIILP
jgi:hypothetical protein